MILAVVESADLLCWELQMIQRLTNFGASVNRLVGGVELKIQSGSENQQKHEKSEALVTEED